MYENGAPIACGALKKYSEGIVEIKRMYVDSSARNKGIATELLTELENWARELDFKKAILETGKRQADAVALYRKNTYTICPNYGQYEGVENSVCFEKSL